MTEESGDPAVGEKEGTDRAKYQAPQIRQRHGEVIPVMNIKLGYFKTILKKHGNKYIKKFLWDNEFTMIKTIKPPATIQGVVQLPGDKSISHR